MAGAIAADEGMEDAAVGVPPNIAARLQALAAPDSVVISAAAYRLIAGYFDCRDLGFHAIRGISQPMAIYQVLHESGARTRLDVAARRGLPPMQGRDDELATLADRWAQARAGQGGVALVAGEPGIGKSRLIWALQQHVAQSPDAFLVHLDCSPYFMNTAFYPVVQLLERVLEFGPDDTASSASTRSTACWPSTVSTSRRWGPCWPGCWRCRSRIATRRSTCRRIASGS